MQVGGGSGGYGGTGEEFLKLGDIGDFRDLGDTVPMLAAVLVGLTGSVGAARFAGAGGFTTNSFWDSFGLEGVVAKGAWLFLILQATRWLYTSFYTMGVSRPWSPIVFVAIALVVQILHDLLFYYGLVRGMPSGKNDIVDSLKKVVAENGSRILTSHAVLFIAVAAGAMLFKETNPVAVALWIGAMLYLLPLLLTTGGPKPVAAVAAKPVAKEGGGGGGMREGISGPMPSNRGGGGAGGGGGGAFDMPAWSPGMRF